MSDKKNEKITIDFSEPEEYFPKEIREKYFGKDDEEEEQKDKNEKKDNKEKKNNKELKDYKESQNGYKCIYVRTKDHESREKLIDFLENEGFTPDDEFGDTKQSILESRYPIKVNVQQKTYGVIHNTMSAAAAVSSGAVIGEEEFYEMYMGNG